MTALIGFVSLGVDLGRVQLAKTELRRAADAAARYALQGISDGTAVAKGVASGAENKVDESAVALLNADVETGTWASGAFTPGGASPNAVRVTARRIKSRGTAIPLFFGSALGAVSCDVVAVSVAYKVPSGPSNYAAVGLTSVALAGGSKTDSYNSVSGAYGGANLGAAGDVGSNGSVTMGGAGTRINGDLDYGNGKSASVTAPATVSGGQSELAGALSMPGVTAPASGSYIYMGPAAVSSGSMIMPGGTYLFDSVTVAGGTFSFSGPATVYVNGAIAMSGGAIRAYLDRPGNLKIISLTASPVALSGSIDLYADLYAPLSAFTTVGTPELYGRIIAKTVLMNGGTVHFDASITGVGTVSGAGAVSIVK